MSVRNQRNRKWLLDDSDDFLTDLESFHFDTPPITPVRKQSKKTYFQTTLDNVKVSALRSSPPPLTPIRKKKVKKPVLYRNYSQTSLDNVKISALRSSPPPLPPVRKKKIKKPLLYRNDSQTSLDNARPSSPWETSRQKLLPINHVGIWKFGERDYFASVPNKWSVSRCIRHVKEILHRRGDLDLWVKNLCIMLDKGKLLSDYAGLTMLHVVRRPNIRNPHPRYRTSQPDVTDPFSDDECVLMPCGHALSPGNLFQYYWNKIKSGYIDVACPALPDENNQQTKCEAVWKFPKVRLLACLSADERLLFLSVLFMNWLEKNSNVYLCPQCDEAVIASCRGNGYFDCYFCQRRAESYTFCIRCLGQVRPSLGCSDTECQRSFKRVKSLIRACRVINIVGVPGCPTVRACPVCQFIVEYDGTESCKHMTCPNRTCRTRFCFICLRVPSDSGYFPCGGAFDQCIPAPRQYLS